MVGVVSLLERLKENVKESYVKQLQQSEKPETKSYRSVRIKQDLRNECLEMNKTIEENISVFWMWLE
jgi:DNA-binding HxlR family transcriptional regulator